MGTNNTYPANVSRRKQTGKSWATGQSPVCKRVNHRHVFITTDTHIDITAEGWKSLVLSFTEIQDSIETGVFCALLGRGWSYDADTVRDLCQHVNVKLLETHLDSFDPGRGALATYCRVVAYHRTLNYLDLHRWQHDCSEDTASVSGTDSADDPSNCVVPDDSAALNLARIEQRERLTRALEALESAERSHAEALFAGDTSAQWARGNGSSPVRACRQKKVIMATLAAFVQA